MMPISYFKTPSPSVSFSSSASPHYNHLRPHLFVIIIITLIIIISIINSFLRHIHHPLLPPPPRCSAALPSHQHLSSNTNAKQPPYNGTTTNHVNVDDPRSFDRHLYMTHSHSQQIQSSLVAVRGTKNPPVSTPAPRHVTSSASRYSGW